MCGPSNTRGSGFVADGLIGIPLTYIFTINVILTALLFYILISNAGWAGVATQLRLVILCCYYTFVIGYGMGFQWFVSYCEATTPPPDSHFLLQVFALYSRRD
jgi:hypothetical protein